MTAKGELYANEDCRDFAKEALDKRFGKDKWYLDGGSWNDVWDISQLPNIMEIKILADDVVEDDFLGFLVITNKFYVEDGMGGKYIEVEPESFRIAEICKHKDCKNIVPRGDHFIYLQAGYCSNNCRFDRRE